MRTWQKWDTFIWIQSLNPGFVGNNIHGAETEESEMIKTHVLVALVGQVEVKSRDIIEQGRRIMTSDGQFIWLRLSNGNVFIK
ncbi:MAG: hypothetical protein ACD_78C00286G0001 [uncultured bacterium (gcode 4)]|uniref:Uncharacterized protein n=1 Tax=uncultured bacterium (gcode 4) TaxID=1234023 RepID=K1YBP3_9BACT|nr:MAG: hypothetical protein ACD_78C00286G0001 [uncultured bacterium (gcode 4)]